VESVAWVSERKDVLSTLLWMLTLSVYISYVRQPNRWRYAGVAVCFALGLMAKPMLVTLPATLLLLDVWPLRRPFTKRLVVEKLPLAALSVVSSVATVIVQQQSGAVARLDVLPLSVRIANAIVSYAQYLVNILWPAHLAVMYPASRTVPDAALLAGAAVLLASITAASLAFARQRPYLLIGWLWFLVTLLPVIGIIQVGVQSMADRYTYVPAIGIFMMLAWGISELVERLPRARIAVAVGAAAALAACFVGTTRQVRHWQSSRALWEHAIAVTDENYFAHASLGYVLWKEGSAAEGLPHLREALRIRPDFAEAHNNLGVVLAGRGDLTGAVGEFTEATRIDPNYQAAQGNLSAVRAKLAAPDTSLARYSEAVQAKPNDFAARNELGAALAARGRVDEAIGQFREALRIDPNQPDLHYNLGMMLDQKGDAPGAIRELDEALRLRPTHTAAREALATIKTRAARPR
jgi:Flp pilus assembly protein TadD